MKKVIIVLFFFSCFVRAQKLDEKIENGKFTQIGFGCGIKYDLTNPYYYESRKPGFAFTVELANDFWQTQKHFLGLELVGHSQTYEHNALYKKKLLYYFNLLYKRRDSIYSTMFFETDIGLSLYSNDEEPSFGPLINVKVVYKLNYFEVFIKNSFRWGSFFYVSKPWLLTVGISTQI
ncbi:MAG: hypothetical protein AB1394_04580 [Bacteroidota bacterium]